MGVGRVIARPFVGEPGNFKRTTNRHDYALPPAGETLLDRMTAAGRTVVAIGKIQDLPELIAKYDVGVVILAQHRRNPISCHKVMNLCKQTKARLVILQDVSSYFN